MKVAVYYNNQDVRIEEMPKPVIGDGELLIKVIASGICGSDVMEWYRRKRAPCVLGHEVTGEVVEAGEGVERFKTGERVFVSHHVPCNKCRYCLNGHHTVCETLHTTNFYPGGFAEYIRAPAINVNYGTFVLPQEVSFEEGTFIEPLACVVRAQRISQLRPGQDVLILGSGISGLLHLLLAREQGAKKVFVTDINEYRLNAAEKFGADAVINAKEDVPSLLRQANEARGADMVIICASAFQAFMQALECVERGGTILCFAPTEPGVTLPVPVNDFWRRSIKIIHSYGSSPQDAAAAIKLIRSRRLPLSKMITHRLSLNEAGEGFHLVAGGGKAIKVIIEPHKSL